MKNEKGGGGGVVCNILDETPKFLDLRRLLKQIISAFALYEILV